LLSVEVDVSKEVVLPYDSEWSALEWAIEHCPSYITNQAVVRPETEGWYDIAYYFAEESDAVMFMLRWL
jgi:hypothetical protein